MEGNNKGQGPSPERKAREAGSGWYPDHSGGLEPGGFTLEEEIKPCLFGSGDHLCALYRDHCFPRHGKHMLVVCEMILGGRWTNFVFLFL